MLESNAPFSVVFSWFHSCCFGQFQSSGRSLHPAYLAGAQAEGDRRDRTNTMSESQEVLILEYIFVNVDRLVFDVARVKANMDFLLYPSLDSS
jgi:hypothetical protein